MSACVFEGLKPGPEGLQMLAWLHSAAGISLFMYTPCAHVRFSHVRYPVVHRDMLGKKKTAADARKREKNVNSLPFPLLSEANVFNALVIQP